MPGYSVIYDGKSSTIKPGHVNNKRNGPEVEHFDTWTDARRALTDYFVAERDEWARLVQVWRYRAAYQLWSGAIPDRVKRRRGIQN